MKNALKKWYNYLISFGIICVLVISGLFPYLFGNKDNWPIEYVCYFLIFSGIVVVGIGFVIQDIYRAVIRKRINDWTNPLNIRYINKAWSIYFPLFSGGIITFLSGIIMNLFI